MSSECSNSEYSVEGEWGEFEFRKIVKSDYPCIIKHIQVSFCKNEPLLTCLGYTEELKNDVGRSMEESLELDQKHGLSFIAVHSASQKVLN